MKISDLHFNLGPWAIIRNVSFELKPGLTALVGPNGSGKTTLLRLMSAYYQPTSGFIEWAGRDLRAYPKMELARHIAVMSQEEWLSQEIRVLDYVLLGRMPHALAAFFDEAAQREVARKALAQVDALSWQDRPMQSLSGGEKQRVMLARALAQEPKILLLDEPMSHLDWSWQKASLELIRRVARENGMCVLSVVHDPNLASFYFDHILFLKEGHLLLEGGVDQTLNEVNLERVFGVGFDVYKNAKGHRVFVPHEND